MLLSKLKPSFFVFIWRKNFLQSFMVFSIMKLWMYTVVNDKAVYWCQPCKWTCILKVILKQNLYKLFIHHLVPWHWISWKLGRTKINLFSSNNLCCHFFSDKSGIFFMQLFFLQLLLKHFVLNFLFHALPMFLYYGIIGL